MKWKYFLVGFILKTEIINGGVGRVREKSCTRIHFFLFLSSSEMFIFATNLGFWYHTVIVYLFTKVVWAEGKGEEVMN